MTPYGGLKDGFLMLQPELDAEANQPAEQGEGVVVDIIAQPIPRIDESGQMDMMTLRILQNGVNA